MTFMTGDEYFPGGMGEFLCEQNEFLVFEDGPSMDIRLQWATYRDASDECSLSRIWGGIHPSLDDIPGRFMGIEVGEDAFAYSDSIFNQRQIQFSLKSILEGPYDRGAGSMDDFYRTDGLLGNLDPYGLGTEVDADVLVPTNEDAVVDWMKVELRDKDDPTIIISEKAVLVQRDGDMIDETGKLQISFNNLNAESYYISIKHYNHLGVMTASPVNLSTATSIDFTLPTTDVYSLGGLARKNDNGIMTLWAGDANGDGNINAIDKNLFWKVQNGSIFQYGSSGADFNLDGVINAIDLNFYWRFNNSFTIQIPE